MRVVAVASGERALQVIGHGGVDLVVLDARMPGMSGADVLRRVRASRVTQVLPVLMLTADDDVAHRVQGLDLGATDYVIKPFEIDELVARVRGHLRSRDAWQQQLQERLDERRMIARALSTAVEQSSVEQRASAICETLRLVPGIEDAAILWLTPEGSAIAIAQAGASMMFPVAVPLPDSIARYLALRASTGPWLERGSAMFVEGWDDTFGNGPLAWAPIGVAANPDGLMALVPRADSSARELAHVLAAAVDYAAVTTGLLGRALHARGAEHSGRVDLEAVMLDQRFTPWYQPVVELQSGAVVGFEALTRFRDGTPPDRRFAQAARVGLGLDLEATTVMAALHGASHLPADRWVSVNVSAAMIGSPELLGRCLTVTQREVVLELTEHDPVEDYDALRVALDRLPQRYPLSVDDAGAGFASLRHILRLDPDYIKLDRTWAENIHADSARQALVAGLVHFASRTGATLIAEGIENPAQADALRELGVPLAQGYLLGRPAPSGAGAQPLGPRERSR